MAEETLTRRLMDQVSEELLKPFREPVDSVYIDADFLYDYTLGKLLMKIEGQEEYSYVLHYLKDYVNGCSRNILKYFPALPLTPDDFKDIETTPDLQKMLHAVAPPTKFLQSLGDFIVKINTFNLSKDITKPIRVIINQRHPGMPVKIWTDLRDHLKERCGALDLKLTFYKSWNDVPMDEFLSWKMVLVYDLVEFMREGTTSQKALKDNKCLNKIVLSPFQTENDFEDKEKEQKALENFSAIMTLLVSEFSFVKKSVLIEE